MRGLSQSVAQMRLPLPPDTPQLTEPDVARLARGKQRNWSIRTPVPQSTPPCEIPKDVRKVGFVGYDDDLGYLHGVPGHRQSSKIAGNVLKQLTGDRTRDNPHRGEWPVKNLTYSFEKLRSLMTGKPLTKSSSESSASQQLDMFRLCERINAASGPLKAKRRDIADALEQTPDSTELKMKLTALAEIRNRAVEYCRNFVNANTFLPMAATTPDQSEQDDLLPGVATLGKDIFGIEPVMEESEGNWAGGDDLQVHEDAWQFRPENKKAHQQYLEHAAQVFGQVKAMLEPTATESGGQPRVSGTLTRIA